MAINKGNQSNVDKSNLAAYPNGQVKDDDGTGDGFPLIQVTVSDIYETFDKILRQSGQTYNNNFDNETNGYQFVKGFIALASKSDYILTVTTAAGVLQIPTALGILQANEKLICLAAADLGAETTIIGNDSVTKTISASKPYKNGDYLMLINNGGNIAIVQWITGDNLNVAVAANAFLKATTNTVELAGTATGSATTPASNLYAFQQRVNDPTNAAPYIATSSQPGLLSIALFNLINNFVNPVKNVGWFSGVDPGGGTVGASAPVSGDITSAVIQSIEPVSAPYGGSTTYLVTIANGMTSGVVGTPGTNYFVRMMVRSEGTMNTDNNIYCPVFRPISPTTFLFSLQEGIAGTQNLKIHCEVVQISS
jgi:hypothetical protein